MRANSIVNWFVAMFAELKLEGCSSHSGRRTFITAAAKNVHRAGGSLRDVQLLAGHDPTFASNSDPPERIDLST